MSIYDAKLFVDREPEFKAFLKLLDPSIPQTGMLISADEDMGKTWLLARLALYFSSGGGSCPVVQLDFRHPREQHRMQDGLDLMRLIRDKLNLPAYFQEFNAVVVGYTASSGGPPIRALQNLADKIDESYATVDNLRVLAGTLDVDPENLPHNIKAALAYGLVRQMHAVGRLAELIDELCAKRPQRADEWRAGLAEITAGGAPAEAMDTGGPLRAGSDLEYQKAQAEIADTFFKCLAALLADRQLMVLLIDHYDETDDQASQPEARRWVRGELLQRLSEGSLRKLVVIICGRHLPRPADLGLDTLLLPRELKGLRPEDIREYWLVRRQAPLPAGMTPDTLPDALADLTGGVPGELARMAKRILDKNQKADPFFDDTPGT